MRKFLAAFSTLFVVCAAASALEVPPRPSSYVNDYASVLSAGARASLEAELAAFDRETSNQLVVATFVSLEGGSLEDFSIRLAEKWKPGTEKKDNGVVLLVFRDDRQVRIEVGYGLEGALPDALAKRIIEREIVPRFKQGDFDGGIDAACAAIMQATRGEYKAESSEDPADKYAPWVFLVLVLYMLVPPVCYLLIAGLSYSLFGVPGLALAAVVTLLLDWLRRALLSAGPTYSRRGGGWYSGGSGRGFGGGGFGGFSGGGGGFGGGGASGRW